MSPLGVGICIDSTNLWSNGCIQNAYFLAKAFKGAGFPVRYIAPEKDVTSFGLPGAEEPVLPLDEASFPFGDFCVIVTVTKTTTPAFADACAARGVRIIKFIAGNYPAFLSEEFVLGANTTGDSMIVTASTLARNVAEVWTYPGLAYYVPFLETITHKRVRVIPHTWDASLIEAHVMPSPWPTSSAPAHIVILESNYSLCKSAFYPLLACERLHARDAGAIKAVHVFNAPKHKKAVQIMDVLDLKAAGKVQLYDRMALPTLLKGVARLGGPLIVLSHVAKNPLNYASYELLCKGFALVHNSPMLSDLGYYYEGDDIEGAARAVRRALDEHDQARIAETMAAAAEWLKRCDPSDPNVQRQLREAVIDAVLCR